MVDTFDSKIRGLSRKFDLRLKVNDEEVNPNVKHIKITKGLMGDDLSFGTMFVPALELELLGFDNYIIGEKIEIELGVYVDKNNDYEYVQMGTYYVMEESYSEGLTKIMAIGALGSKLKGLYVSELESSATVEDIISEIKRKRGVDILLGEEIPKGMMYDEDLEGLEYREVLCNIAALCNANVTEDLQGRVIIKSIASGSTFEYDGDYCIQAPSFSEAYTLTRGDEEISFNPGEIPLSLGNPQIEPWDIVKFRDKKGQFYVVPALNIVHTFDGGLSTTVMAPGSDKVVEPQNITGPITEKVERAFVKMQAVENLMADKANINALAAIDAKIEELQSVSAEFKNLKIKIGDLEKVYVDELEAVGVDIEKLHADKVDISMANIDEAWIKDLLVSGNILAQNINGASGSFSHDLVGVNIIGDNITAGTISTERLIVKSKDDDRGILFALNDKGQELDQSQLSREELKRLTLDGKIITADSINAEQINVGDLFSQNITATGNFEMGANGALKYNKDRDTLELNANVIKIEGKNVMTEEDLQDCKTSIEKTNEQILMVAEKNAENEDSMKTLKTRMGVLADGVNLAVKTAEDINSTFDFTTEGLVIGKSDSAIKSIQDNKSYKFKDNADNILLNVDTSGIDASSISVQKQVSYYGQWATRKGLEVLGVGHNLNDIWIGG